MKIDTMRAVDYWIGIPLLFITTFLIKPFLYFRKQKKPKNILFIELSEMGSVILANPALIKAKSNLNTNLYFAIFSKNSNSIKLLNTVPENNVFTMDNDNLFTLSISITKFIFWCRKNKIDSTIDLELFSRFSALLTLFSGANNRVGFYKYYLEGLYRGNLLTHKVIYNPYIHIAKNFIALINTLIENQDNKPNYKSFISDKEISLPVISSTYSEINCIYNKIKNLYPNFIRNKQNILLININAGDMLPQRKWSLDQYEKLILKLINLDEDNLIILTGSHNEYDYVEKIKCKVNNGRCINFAGQVKFQELTALYNAADLMVTNDSGPAHFSSITKLYTYVLFGPETPILYGPLGKNSRSISANLACSPCVSAFNHRKIPCNDNQCMKKLDPELVYKFILRDWEEIKNTKKIPNMEYSG